MFKELWGMGTATLKSFQIVLHKLGKVLYFDLKENNKGLFIKITEVCGGKRDTVVFPQDMGPSAALAILELSKGPGVAEAIAILSSYRKEVNKKWN